MGATESSLYQSINATESSEVGGLISQGRLTFALIKPDMSIEAADLNKISTISMTIT